MLTNQQKTLFQHFYNIMYLPKRRYRTKDKTEQKNTLRTVKTNQKFI